MSKKEYILIYSGNIGKNHLSIVQVHNNDVIYLYDNHKPYYICDHTFSDYKLFFYNEKIEFENLVLPDDTSKFYYRQVKLSEILSKKADISGSKIILLDIENGKDILLDYSKKEGINELLSNAIIIALNEYNEYSSISFSNLTLDNVIFYGLPQSMRVYYSYGSYGRITFIDSKCSLIMDKSTKKLYVHEIKGIDVNEVYDIYDPLDSIRNFNEKRGLIEQGFDLRRELNFIVEEVVEATNINLGSDKAKEKAKVIVDKLLKECVTTNENSMDAFIDIIVFAVGALYKLAPRMDIDVKEEIMKVIRNIEFKPYLKDENGKVIKDPNYKKYREKK